MNYFLEWGVAPVNDAPIDPLVLDTLAFEATTLNTAKGQSLKHVKACPKVIAYFSSESEPWDASDSQWEDWQPTADSADRPGFKYTSRQSEDLCVKSLAGASCRVYMILSWQDKKAASEASGKAPHTVTVSGDFPVHPDDLQRSGDPDHRDGVPLKDRTTSRAEAIPDAVPNSVPPEEAAADA